MSSMQIYIIRQLCLKYQKFSGPETKALLLRYLVFNLIKFIFYCILLYLAVYSFTSPCFHLCTVDIGLDYWALIIKMERILHKNLVIFFNFFLLMKKKNINNKKCPNIFIFLFFLQLNITLSVHSWRVPV